MSEDSLPVAATGIVAYDLVPPSSLPPVPVFSPFRHPAERQRRPRWTPPPLTDGHVRVELDEDYYAGPGWTDWNGSDADYPSRIFDIPAEIRERWLKAMDAYAAMQDEIEALLSARRAQVPPGWTQKPPYQARP